MGPQPRKDGSYQNLGNQGRKTWFNRLLGWTWKTVVFLISLTIRVALAMIWLTASLVAFVLGMMSAYSMKDFRRHQRAKGDYRW